MGERPIKEALRNRPESGISDYEVGYGKPPVHSQFKPGQSGNPSGRPKGAKSAMNRGSTVNAERLKAIVLDEAYRIIGVRDGDRLIEIPVIKAIVRSVALSAAKGDQKSQRMILELLQGVERENKALHDAWLETVIEYKTSWERELHRRETQNLSGLEPFPHPDDIEIDLKAGQVKFLGPMTKDDKVKWDGKVRESSTAMTCSPNPRASPHHQGTGQPP